MTSLAIPAVFMRGGTSKAIMFHARDLPPDRAQWDAIFLAAMGSPDPHGRQLDGMGGGVSSLSKACIIAPSTRDDADVDYTFAQVQVREAHVDYKGNCGNMLSAVGPFAVDEGLARAAGDSAMVRIFNTNTKKLIHARFPLQDGRAAVEGELAIPGVAGTGAPVKLDFIAPGGATTGALLPTGRPLDRLDVPGLGALDVSMVDAANACAFVRAADVGLTGRELPGELEADTAALARLQAIRIAASQAMGIAKSEAEARAIAVVPFICVISARADAPTLSGERISAGDIDFAARFVSNGQPHRALPLTGALCTGVAARIAGTIVAEALGNTTGAGALRLGMPSGVLTVAADVARDGAGWVARSGSFYRTARRLFDGRVHVTLGDASAAARRPHRLTEVA
ncbi:MAG TPA: PrpF domain-containing protein [Stellaceae bacterium]|nr:PrpF domain-containing protein [Stellaceae bacterium]